MNTKKILIIVDPQNDFISGSLKNEEAIDVIPSIVKKINEFDGEYIFVTRDTHHDNYLYTLEGKKLPIRHCIAETHGWKIHTDVNNALQDVKIKNKNKIIYFNKETFGSVDLMNFIELDADFEGFIEIEICGFDTDICVISNALLLKAALFDRCEITVDASCCAGSTSENHKSALDVMRSCQINIIN